MPGDVCNRRQRFFSYLNEKCKNKELKKQCNYSEEETKSKIAIAELDCFRLKRSVINSKNGLRWGSTTSLRFLYVFLKQEKADQSSYRVSSTVPKLCSVYYANS